MAAAIVDNEDVEIHLDKNNEIGAMLIWSNILNDHIILILDESWAEDARDGWHPWGDEYVVYSVRELSELFTASGRHISDEELRFIHECKKMGTGDWRILC